MGLFKFFKRSEKPAKSPLKAQAYNATAPASPPLKGKNPVRGNGPVSIQTLRENYIRKAVTSVVSLSLDNEVSAPPPIVPRFRTETPERPTTAPHSNSGSSSRPVSRSRRESILGPPLSFRKLRAESFLPRKKKSFESSNSHRMTIGYAAPQPEFYGRDRTLSLQSNGTSSTRQFVDILDAQSELRPTNFHSRVKAAGVRGYGEDVADRNLGENGVDVLSPQVQVFYASPDESAPSPIVARTSHHDEDLTRKTRRPLSRGGRTLSLKSHTSEAKQAHHEQSIEPMPTRVRIPLNSPTRSNRGMSLSSYIPPPPQEQRAPRGRQYRSESMFVTNIARDAEFLNILADQLRPRTSWDRSYAVSQEHLASFTTAMATKPPQESRYKKAERRARRQSKTKSKMSTASGYLSPEEPPVPSSRPGLRRSASALVPASPDKVSLKRTSTTSLRASLSHDAASTPGISVCDSHLIPQVCNPVDSHGHTNATQAEYHTEDGEADDEDPVIPGGQDVLDDTDDGACPPPSIRTSAQRHSRATSHGSFSRTRRSLMTSPATSERLEDIIYGQMPNRNSDVRQWSMSSATTPPTTVSSVASMVIQSGHTANSSFDANQQQQSTSLGMSTNNLSAINIAAASSSRPGSVGASASVHMPHSPLTAISNFNIDDYVSSDDDAEDSEGPRRPRGEGEEELLFSEVGYGSMQLPGLFDCINHSAGTGTATPVPAKGAENAPGEGNEIYGGGNATASISGSSRQGTVADPPSQSSGSSPLLSLLVPQAPSQAHGSRISSCAGSLRHALSVPAVRRHSAFGGSSYSSSDYAEEGSTRGSRPSTSGNSRVPAQMAHAPIPRIPPRRRPISVIAPAESIPHVSEQSEENSASESASDFEEEDRHSRAEFARSLEAGQRSEEICGRASPAYVPPILHPHHGPVLKIPLPIKPSTPDTRKPTLPSHQTDEENDLLPIHQIQMPTARKTRQGTITHALESLRYSPAILHSSSSEYLGDEDDAATAPDVPRSRPGSRHAPNSGVAEDSSLPPLPQGYAYGHGGAKYGNGYGFIRVLPEHGGKGSVPGTPVEEKEGFFGSKGKKLARGSLVRSDSRTSMHSDRAREIVRRLKSKVSDD